MKNTSLYVTATCGVALLASCCLISGCGGGANSPDGLVEIALSPPGDEGTSKQEKAALDLGTFPADEETKPKVLAGLRKILQTSDNPKVRTAAIQGLGQLKDWDSMPVIIKSLESPDTMERGRAYWATSEMLRIKLAYDPDSLDVDARKEGAAKIEQYYKFMDQKRKQSGIGG